MHTRILTATFIASALLAPLPVAYAQTNGDDRDAHHPEETVAAEPAPGMSGMMDMMSPDMMQMMMRMHRMMAGQASLDTLPSRMPMDRMAGDDRRAIIGPELLYGMPDGGLPEMTVERVQQLLTQELIRHDNPRLTLGDIAPASDGSIIAEIRTVDGALVQKLAFNRYPGLVRQIAE